MEVSLIEFVCTGNSGRSTVAELIANAYLKKNNKMPDIQAISSGSHVQALNVGKILYKAQVAIINKALNRDDIYNPGDITNIEKSLRHNDETSTNAILDFYQLACRRFTEEEHKFRAEALKYFSIDGIIKPEPEQTIAQPDRIAVLSMAGTNNQAVKKIYDGTGYHPVIDTLGHFTGEEEIPNAFGGTKEKYFTTIEAIINTVPKAIDQLLLVEMDNLSH